MFLIWGLLKALLTDISGEFHPRRMKNPAEDIPIWELGRDIRDFKDLLKMSQDEMSEEQRQALLNDDEAAREANTTLHSFPPSKEELKVAQDEPSQEDGQADSEMPPIPDISLEEVSPDVSGGDEDLFDMDLEE